MPSSKYFRCFIQDASSSAFTFGSSKSCTRSVSSFCVSLWGDSGAGPWKSGSVASSLWGRFLCVFLFNLRIQSVFFWWLRNGQIFPMRHRSAGRGYIWIVNSLLLLSVHTYLSQEVSSNSSSHCCGLRVPFTPLEWLTALPIPLRFIQPPRRIAHNLHTMCGAHFLSWSPSLHPKYR